MAKSVKRLFSQFQPEHYQLALDPDKQTRSFNGTVTITGRKVDRPSQRLTLHQKDLRITDATIVWHDKKSDVSIAVDRINYHARLDEVRLHTQAKLFPGRYTISLTFSGQISDTMTGVYPSLFEHQDQTKVILATQFESHHAREAFPCIDEPEAKATFAFSLTSAADEVTLSNTPIKQQSTSNGRTLTEFETTPRMSTYLLAFVTGELHCAEKITQAGTIVRSWSSVAQPLDHLNYSLDEAVRVLEFFTDYFGVPYPLAKCDQVALPDFDAGAMENWGLITYREIALLADPLNRSVSNEQYISLVVAHELSHQWFGNLVTMKWWDDLWLNESFASLMEHIALDAIHPDWHQWEMYTSTDIISTSSRDVYSDIQPVGVDVTDPALLHTLFDPGIVYAKGGRLLKMLREHIGDQAFTTGLKQYFKQHAYQNTSREDLWRALSAASDQDISALMTPWISQPGMPVLHVDQNKTKLNLRQERFLLDSGGENYTWPIPLLADRPTEPAVLTSRSATINLADPAERLFNQAGSGHYFVHYVEPTHRETVAKALAKRTLPTEARINSLNDMYMLSRHGDLPLASALDIIIGCAREPRDSVWSLLTRIVQAAHQITEGVSASEDYIKSLKRQLAAEWYRKLGWQDGAHDDVNTKQLRHTMVALMVGGEEPSAIESALQAYNSAASLQAIHAELRGTILVAAVRHGGQPVVKRLLAEYASASPDVQLDITTALASNRRPEQAAAILDQAIGANGFVRPQDLLRWLAHFMRNRYVREVSWHFLASNWPRLEQTLQKSKSYDYLPIYCASNISTPEWADRYHDFFDPLLDQKALVRNIQVGSADIAARLAWRQRDETAVMEWLSQHYPA